LPEQRSVRAGLERLDAWRKANPGEVSSYAPITYESPNRLFKVSFVPDFGLRIVEKATAVHIWNTAQPVLQPRLVYAALSLFPPLYRGTANPPDDIAVLSLRKPELFKLSEAADHSDLGIALAAGIEELFRHISDELGLPAKPDKGRPAGPPPPA